MFSEDFSQQVWTKQAAKLSLSNIPFHEKDILDTLKQYAKNPHKLLALNPKSEVVQWLMECGVHILFQIFLF
ncbi:hypothetical protein GCM10023261_10660 [Bartonella jaculi]|uniref:Uncharacterized protein n=1 Tax=Bartonella jaculi TaxID=686226 RepID=A0ABP9N5F2_9HYPH